MNVSQKNYVSAVYQGFIENNKQLKKTISLDSFQSLFDKNINAETLNEQVSLISASFKELNVSGNSKRYKFNPGSNRDELLKAIFHRSLSSKSEENVFAAAENAEPNNGPLYSNWKKVCLIQIPTTIGGVFKHPIFKIAATVATICCSAIALYALYQSTTNFIVAKVVPFLINNTPAPVIWVIKKIVDVVSFIFDYSPLILLSAFIAQQVIIRLPEIPYFTNAVEQIDLWTLFHILFLSPQTISSFILQTTLDTGIFIWGQCDNLGGIFTDIAQETKADCLSVSKQKAFEVWNKMIIENAPA